MNLIFFFVLLCACFFGWVLKEPSSSSFPRKRNDHSILLTIKKNDFYYSSVDKNLRLHAWYFVPTDNTQKQKFPVIVMAHGLCAQKDFKIPEFAEKFVEMGIAVFAFDYRGFGGSDGEPRNVVDIFQQLEDWESTLEFLFQEQENLMFDSSHLVLWGTSFSGGHVLTIASRKKFMYKIKGVISQVPFVDGFDTGFDCLLQMFKNCGFVCSFKTIMYAIKDTIRRSLQMSRQYISVVNESSDTPKILASNDSFEGYTSLLPHILLGGWENKAAAAILLELLFYRPTYFARHIQAQVLLIAADNDTLCPIAGLQNTSKRIKHAKFHVLRNCGHFDPYIKRFEEVIMLEKSFLREIFNLDTHSHEITS